MRLLAAPVSGCHRATCNADPSHKVICCILIMRPLPPVLKLEALKHHLAPFLLGLRLPFPAHRRAPPHL